MRVTLPPRPIISRNAALAAPEELVAVVGRTAADPAIRGAEDGGGGDRQAAVARISGFTGARSSVFTESDQDIALLGGALLIVPVIVLAAAAGRLGTARREQRLAALRLAGATPRQILAMTGVEAAAVGLAGALTGALVYLMLLPVLADVPYGIGSWYVSEVWVGVPWLLAVVTAVALLTAFSAVTTLRGVARSPLGVAQQSSARRTRMVRLLLFTAIVGFVVISAQGGGASSMQQLGLIVLVYGAFWIVGPWVVDRLGRVAGRLARRPATLLAARRLSDDPRGAWRTVSGLVLAGFVAGFFTVGQIGIFDTRYPNQIALPATSSSPDVLLQKASRRLDDADVTATVRTADANSILGAEEGIVVRVRGGQAAIDTALTALSPVSPGVPPRTDDYVNAENTAVNRLIGQVGLASLALGFVIAAASAGLTAAATVLDRRRVYRLLYLAGAPLRVLNQARLRETVLPLVVLAGGTTGTGAYAALRVNAMYDASVSTSGLVQLAVCGAIGTALMVLALAGSGPLLRRVTAEPAADRD
ncbi:FtsX-like permease family protein [Streptomyces sp. NPDC051985]|uniref:FtsX-like permease family protein n=1 Tax=Streptomyces sp. NPDC051985 TaxID=3155807 RepID=UPI00342785B6